MSKLHPELFIGALLFILSVTVVVASIDMPGNAGKYPILIASVLGAFSLLITFSGARHTFQRFSGQDVPAVFDKSKRPMFVFLLICAYVATIEYVGFFISSALFVLLMMGCFGERRILHICSVIIGVLLFVYLLFEWQLGIQLPASSMF